MENHLSNDFPLVSIIVPVFNNVDGLKRCLIALKAQKYPKNKMEVIVVDNGSYHSPFKSLEKCPNYIFLSEDKYKGSPYSARNRGLEVAKGDILVFLDTTCAPTPEWLINGVKALEKSDLVGGEIEFDITEKSSVGEIYDSLFNVQMKNSIEKKGVAKAGNLFITRNVLNFTGFFPEGLRSGGDIRWTAKAVKEGFSLGYSADAKVIILPRKLKPLSQKQYRIAKGHPKFWIENNIFLKSFFKKVVLFWIPPNPFLLLSKVNQSNKKIVKRKYLLLFLVGWYLRSVNMVGCVSGCFKLFKLNNKRNV